MNQNNSTQDAKQISQRTGQGIGATADFIAELVEGKKYVFGGKTLKGLDCSGYVAQVFKHYM